MEYSLVECSYCKLAEWTFNSPDKERSFITNVNSKVLQPLFHSLYLIQGGDLDNIFQLLFIGIFQHLITMWG